MINLNDLNLEEFKLELQKKKFYGETTFVWEDGQIVMMRTNQKWKPKDFHKVSESIVVIEGNFSL